MSTANESGSTNETPNPASPLPSVSWWDQFTLRQQELIDRAHVAESTWRAMKALTIAQTFDLDRELEAVRKAKSLHRDPERISLELKRTMRGCDWLLARWEMLAEALEKGTDWSLAEMKRAMDLLGVAHELRRSDKALPQAREGRSALVKVQIEELKSRKRDGLDAQDAESKAAAIAGLLVPPDEVTKRIVRDRTASERTLRHAIRLRDKAIKAEMSANANRSIRAEPSQTSISPPEPPRSRQPSKAAAAITELPSEVKQVEPISYQARRRSIESLVENVMCVPVADHFRSSDQAMKVRIIPRPIPSTSDQSMCINSFVHSST